MRGTKYGRMVIPGEAEASNLLWLLEWRGAPETHMPLGKEKPSTCDRDYSRLDYGGSEEQLNARDPPAELLCIARNWA